MATKPTLANLRFGETAGGSTAGAHLTTPSSGLRDTGFQPSTPAVAGYVNTLVHETYLWAKYLDDGIIDGDLTADNLHILGDADIDDDLNVDGDAQIDLTLNVGGNATVGGSLQSDQNYHTLDQSLKIPASDAVDPGNVHALSTNGAWWVMTGNPNPLVYPIDVPTGAHITGFTVFCNKGSGASYRAKIVRVTSAFAEDDMGLTPATQAGSGDVTLSPSIAPDITTDATSSYVLRVYPNAGNFQASDKIGTAVVSWTYPRP